MNDDQTEFEDSEILWSNAHWHVTNHGLENRRRTYFIDKSDLLRKEREIVYMWPVHMARKAAVDPDSFVEAWVKACRQHRDSLGTVFDGNVLADTWLEVEQIVGERQKRYFGPGGIGEFASTPFSLTTGEPDDDGDDE